MKNRFELKAFVQKYQKVLLLFASSIIFACDSSVTGWFTFVPVLFLVKKLEYKNVWLYGGLYGAISYTLYAPWLLRFSPPAMLLVQILYFILCAALFELLLLVLKKGGRFSTVLIVFVLVLYEYVKTLGFAGFSYGCTGYTQWKNLYVLQIADFSGVFGVCALLDFCSVVVFKTFDAVVEKRFSLRNVALLIVFQLVIVFDLIYGFVRVQLINARDEKCPKAPVCLIQHNPDMKSTSFASYKSDVETLKELTLCAIESSADGLVESERESSASFGPLVVWPETAVIPSIREYFPLEAGSAAGGTAGSGANVAQEPLSRRERKELVSSLLTFISDCQEKYGASFVIGNFDKKRVVSDFPSYGLPVGEISEDFNSSFFFENGISASDINNIPSYSKIHLVPFSECLPFGLKFPEYSEFARSKNNMLWTSGAERTVFTLNGTSESALNFSTPICFEDTFGRDARAFYKNGARAFVNLSNDAWSKSRRCQRQHLKMAVFRSVENHVPSVRSTASGETCIISSVGKVEKRIAPFKKDFLVGAIPVLR